MKKRTKKTGNQRVLELLRKRRNIGVSFSDFGAGFRLSSVIHVLRHKWNITIHSRMEYIPELNTSIAHYILVKE